MKAYSIAIMLTSVLLMNVMYASAYTVEVNLDVYNTKFETHRSSLVGDAYTFETANTIKVYVSERLLDRIKDIYGTTEFVFTYQNNEYNASYRVWDVKLSANVVPGKVLTVRFVSLWHP